MDTDGHGRVGRAQLRWLDAQLAEAAAWNGGRGEHDLASLSLLPEVLAAGAVQQPTKHEQATQMEAAVEAAREALRHVPPSHPMHVACQLCLARMISNFVTLSNPLGPDGKRAEGAKLDPNKLMRLVKEGQKAAVSARETAKRTGNSRQYAMAEQLLASNQPLGQAVAQTSATPEEQTPPLLGRRVRIDGLAARPELNGQSGTAAEYLQERGRYGVRLDDGTVIALKPDNLTADAVTEPPPSDITDQQ
jgi:hypothetical protein